MVSRDVWVDCVPGDAFRERVLIRHLLLCNRTGSKYDLRIGSLDTSHNTSAAMGFLNGDVVVFHLARQISLT
jgi:hypothetical protein